MRITLGRSAEEGPEVRLPPRVGSAAEAVGDERLATSVDIPWDSYLGRGAGDRVRDGSLATVRHAYPAGAAADMLAAATVTGLLLGDAAAHERLAAVAVGIASAHHRPTRLPHRPQDEPHAWWVDEEKTLVWLPWGDIDEIPYGLALLDSGEADSVMVLAPDACWTVYVTGFPGRDSRGGWDELGARLRAALEPRIAGVDRPSVRWRRERGDDIEVMWRRGGSKGAIARLTVDLSSRLRR